MKKYIKRTLATAFFVLVLHVAGNIVAEDEQLELQQYCENVEAGVWPDYKYSYEEDCK